MKPGDVSKLSIIGSDDGLSPGRRLTIIWTNDDMWLIGPLESNFNDIFVEIYKFSFQNVVWKMATILSRPQRVNRIGPRRSVFQYHVLMFCKVSKPQILAIK